MVILTTGVSRSACAVYCSMCAARIELYSAHAAILFSLLSCRKHLLCARRVDQVDSAIPVTPVQHATSCVRTSCIGKPQRTPQQLVKSKTYRYNINARLPGCSAVGSASALGAEGRTFESCHSDQRYHWRFIPLIPFSFVLQESVKSFPLPLHFPSVCYNQDDIRE